MELIEKYFDTGEVKLHVMEGPQTGPPMALLHGATGRSEEWMNIVPHLIKHWHVYAVDLRGHGLSGRPASRDGYHMSHNVSDTLTFLREHVQAPAVLVGHSYGAVTSILTGMYAKESLRAMVLEDPPLLLRREERRANPHADYFGWVYQMRQTTADVETIHAELAVQNPQESPERLRLWAENLALLDPNFPLALSIGDRRETVRGLDFAAHIRGIPCPVLLMHADPQAGGVMPQEDVDFFMENVPNGKLVDFPGVGHGIHTDSPEAFLMALDEFLAGV